MIHARKKDDPNYERNRKQLQRQANYAKRRKEKEEPRPTIRSAPKVDTKGMPVTPLSEFTAGLLKRDINLWDFHIRQQVNIHTTVSFLIEDMIMKEKQASGCLHITGQKEIDRTYKILFLGETVLEVKQSLIPNSGYGLFVARPGGFKAHEVVGMYFGAIQKPNVPSSSYAYSWFGVDGEFDEAVVLDAKGGVKSGHGKGHPVYFGIHMANDSNLSCNPNDKVDHNLYMTEELQARVSRDVKYGEELYLNYRYEDQPECSCSGCKEVNKKYV